MESETGATVAAGVGQMNPAALTVAKAARLLGVAEQTVHDHVAAGAPTAAGGTINLVHYVAWINQQLKDHDGD